MQGYVWHIPALQRAFYSPINRSVYNLQFQLSSQSFNIKNNIGRLEGDYHYYLSGVIAGTQGLQDVFRAHIIFHAAILLGDQVFIWGSRDCWNSTFLY